MTTVKSFFRLTFLLGCHLFLGTGTATASDILFVGSTPGDEAIKTVLAIPVQTKVDFIRWQLKLSGENSFDLNITYGESQPNTLGFMGGGEKKAIRGHYSITNHSKNDRFAEVYRLTSDDAAVKISMVKLSENLLHILNGQNQLMIGNGGWSYSLNRKDKSDGGAIFISSAPLADRSLQVIYDGRTPCHEIAEAHPEMKATSSCFKIKWRLILNRDAATYQPTTCTIRNIVDNQPRDVSGRWSIIKGTGANPGALIYKIEVDNLAEPILLFAGDENVLFFLDKQYQPFIGNEDFSFAMNKKRP